MENIRQLNREVFDDEAIVLQSLAACGVYEDTVEAYLGDGDRAALYSSLLALGVPADTIRWHAANPGERRITITVDTLC